MQSAKEKISDMASAAKAHTEIYKAKVEEKAEKATARTVEERKIAEERKKVKEAAAKMELHQDKARHAAETLDHRHHVIGGHHHHGLHEPVGAAGSFAGGAPAPTYPLGTQYPPSKYL